MDFHLLESNRIQGVFLVDADTKPEDIQLRLVWDSQNAAGTSVSGWDVDVETWTTPRFLDLTLEEDIEFYGHEPLEPGDPRVFRGVETWYDVSLQCSSEANVTIDEFRDALNLKYHFEPLDHDVIDWWLVSEVQSYASTLEGVEKKFAQSNSEHLAARAKSMVFDTKDSDASSTNNPNPVKDFIDQTKQGLSMIEQLLDDMEDEEFWTSPEGEWEAKNGRKGDGTPRES